MLGPRNRILVWIVEFRPKLNNPCFSSTQKLEETIQKEEEESDKKREFKAKFPMVLYQDAFVPEKNSQISDMAEFNLHSDKRGDKRRAFDEEVKATQEQREREQEAHEAALKVRLCPISVSHFPFLKPQNLCTGKPPLKCHPPLKRHSRLIGSHLLRKYLT